MHLGSWAEVRYPVEVCHLFALLAQLEERLICNHDVASSIPAEGTKDPLKKPTCVGFFLLVAFPFRVSLSTRMSTISHISVLIRWRQAMAVWA